MGTSRAKPACVDRRRRRSPSSAHKRLKHARFPAPISTLTHVLNYIDVLLMTPCEALVEAARTNEFEWMWKLLDQVGLEVLKKAFNAAAREGHLGVVRSLRLEFRSTRTGRREYETGILVKDATVAAAQVGHLAVVKYLLKDLPDRDFDIRWRILDEGAANGHIPVVEFGAGLTTRVSDLAYECSDAVHLATFGGHVEIVRFLLEPGRFTWRYLDALEHAIAENQRVIAELVYRRLAQHQGCNAILELVERRKFPAIQFLCSHNFCSTKWFEDALVKAASQYPIRVLEFLLRCRPISPVVFDEAFERAASAGRIAAMHFLYDWDEINQDELLTTFESTRSAGVVEFVYGKVDGVPVQSVQVAVENAAFCGLVDGVHYRPGKEQSRILQFLSSLDCIPGEVVNKLFEDATRSFQPAILNGLSCDKSLSPERIVKAFLRAAQHGCVELVKTWVSKPCIFGEVVIEAFHAAVAHDHRDIVAMLFDMPGITRSVQEQAIVIAARCNGARVVKFICNLADWPVEVLVEAHGAAHYKKIRKFLGKKLNPRHGPENTPASKFDADGSFVG